jgi:hypothetical protein
VVVLAVINGTDVRADYNWFRNISQ